MPKHLCSKAVYKTWLRRFWPGSVLMLLVYLLAAVGMHNAVVGLLARAPAMSLTPGQFTGYLFTPMLLIFTAGAGAAAGFLCFGYLQNPASACAVHALPLRRAGIFASVCAAGFSLLGGPVLLSALLFSAVMLMLGAFFPGMILWYILLHLLCAVLFFAVMALGSMLCGHGVASLALSAAVLAGPVLLDRFFMLYCQRYLYGFVPDTGVLVRTNPVFLLFNWMAEIARVFLIGDVGLLPLWPGLVLLAMAAALLVAAVFIYRRRNVETAGDVVAAKPMRPVFRVVLALFGSGFLWYITRFFQGASSAFALELLFAAVGGVLGYFVAEALLTRSLKVWRRWKGAAVYCAALVLVMLGLFFDVTGYGSHQLDAQQVEFIVVGDLSPRINAAMRGGPLYSYDVLEDLGLQNADEYLELVGKDAAPNVPPDIALQILQNDYMVLKGPDAETAVAFQNSIAQNSRALLQQWQPFAANGYTLYDGAGSYYTVPVMAKMRDGSTFYRNYQLVFPSDEQAQAYGELLADFAEILRLNAVGQAENVLNMSRVAYQVYFNFDTGIYTQANSGWALNPGEWDGLFEAMLEDAKTRPGESLLRGSMAFGPPAIHCTLEFAGKQSVFLQLDTNYPNTMQWLVEQGILTEEDLEDAAAAAQRMYGIKVPEMPESMPFAF